MPTPLAPDIAVEAHGLVKRFGDTVAVDGVDLQVPRGAIYGLLGPNGAGKTTTVRLLTTLLRPDAGTATIDGIDVAREPTRVRARIGLTGQYAAVEERMTGRENLVYVARLFHMSGADARSRSREGAVAGGARRSGRRAPTDPGVRVERREAPDMLWRVREEWRRERASHPARPAGVGATLLPWSLFCLTLAALGVVLWLDRAALPVG